VEIVRTDSDTFMCTNHYRSRLQAGEIVASAAWAMHSRQRNAGCALVNARTAPLSARDLAGFLGDRRDATRPSQRRHVGAILAHATNVHYMVVAPSSRRAWVGVDRAPC
jgi:hypothetical protein